MEQTDLGFLNFIIFQTEASLFLHINEFSIALWQLSFFLVSLSSGETENITECTCNYLENILGMSDVRLLQKPLDYIWSVWLVGWLFWV